VERGWALPFTAGWSWTTVWTTTFSKDPENPQKRTLAHHLIWRGSSKDFEGVVVPRDRIELSTPAFSGQLENEKKQSDKQDES